MSVATAIYALLAADAAVSALVGTRIYPESAPDGATLPYIVYERVGGLHHNNMSGISGLDAARIDINCIAETYAEVDDLANKVRLALSGYSGTSGGVRVQSLLLTTSRDGAFDHLPGQETRTRRRILSFDAMADEATS